MDMLENDEQLDAEADFIDIANAILITAERLVDERDYYYTKTLYLQLRKLLESQGMTPSQADTFLFEEW